MLRSAARSFGITIAALATLGLAGGVAAADAERGKVLYETRCAGCHNSSVHQSTSRKATSFSGIRQQVARWSAQQGTSWDPGDVENITVYLNDLYYKLPCPTEVCAAKVSSLAPR
jgi:hypothetical protein